MGRYREAKTGYPLGEGRAGRCHGKFMLGQAEPDLYLDTVLVVDLLCCDLIHWDICEAPSGCRKHREAGPRMQDREGQRQIDDCWEKSQEEQRDLPGERGGLRCGMCPSQREGLGQGHCCPGRAV